jgi:hypothetical protein
MVAQESAAVTDVCDDSNLIDFKVGNIRQRPVLSKLHEEKLFVNFHALSHETNDARMPTDL